MDDPIEVLITLPFADELMKQISEVSPRLAVDKIVARKADEINDEFNSIGLGWTMPWRNPSYTGMG
jgi:hypothetical protein